MYSVVQLGPRSFCQTLRRIKKGDRLPATYFAISNPYKSSVYKSANNRLKGVDQALAPGGRRKLSVTKGSRITKTKQLFCIMFLLLRTWPEVLLVIGCKIKEIIIWNLYPLLYYKVRVHWEIFVSWWFYTKMSWILISSS